MKKLLIILLTQFFINCTQKREVSTSQNLQSTVECNIISDTLEIKYFDPISNQFSINEVNALKGFSRITPQLDYSVDKYRKYKFKILNNDFAIVLDSCIYKDKSIASFYVRSKPIRKNIVHIKDSIYYGFDNLAVDYNRSEFYYNSEKNLIFIKSFSERLVGRAVNWRFCQLIDISKPEMFEFYVFED